MMYNEKFIAVIKCNDKIMRENGTEILLPFGEEYSILLKNLNSKKAQVSIFIDGQDILYGKKLIIEGNSELELERFLENENEGNRLKFIQKTEKIQEYRGDKVDDGIVRIKFQYEKDIQNYFPIVSTPLVEPAPSWYNNDPFKYQPTITYSDSIQIDSTPNIICGTNTTLTSNNIRTIDSNCITKLSNNISNVTNCNFNSLPQLDEGITVKGTLSNQKFEEGNIGILEENSHIIILKLKGYTSSGKEVKEPITVKTPKICTTCGTKNKSINKFCRECGTYLD